VIVGGGGADTIDAREGSDRIEVRDGERDRVACGEGDSGPTTSDTDTAISDRLSLDALADCESVDALPEPSQPGEGPTGPTDPTDPVGTPDTAVSFSLTAASRQRVVRQRAVHVKVTCPEEPCTAVASASGRVRAATIRLRPVSVEVAAGSTRTLKLRLTRRQLAAIHNALSAGRRPRMKVTVRVRDGAGNSLERAVRVTARR
jgi:hypothetical protein